jgi:hypothetical protein
MVPIEAKNVIVAATGGPEELVNRILDAMETFLHMLYEMDCIAMFPYIPKTKDGNFTHGYGYRRIPYLCRQGMSTLLYPWVVLISLPLNHG